MVYDSSEIRAASRKIKQYAEMLNSSAEPALRKIRNERPEYFIGMTADAFDDRLEIENKNARTIYEAMCNLSRTLSRYADALEEADEKVARMM